MTNGSTVGVVKYYDKLLLQIVDGGTSVSFMSPSGETIDIITGKFGYSYIPKIFSNDGSKQLYYGDPLIDSETGIITFYNINATEVAINAGSPPRISFYKYVGTKGVGAVGNFLPITGGTITGNLIVSGGTISGNGSGLTEIPASGITGLQLDRISNGSNTAIMSASGLDINTGVTISGALNIYGDIYQTGSTWQTHTNQIYSTADTITLRDGAQNALAPSGYTGIIAHKYDGANDGVLVFDNKGIARVGDMDTVTWTGTTQPLTTRDEAESMTDGSFTYWSSGETKIKTSTYTINNISNLLVPSGRTITTSSGLTGGGNLGSNIIISHGDTSNASNIVSTGNTNGVVLQQIDVELDTFGHITGGSATMVDLDNRYYTQGQSENKFINASGDTMTGNLTLSGVSITITSGGTINGDASGLYNIPASGITGSISGLTGGTIGVAEDGTYADGIFTDFVPSTPIGTAIDRFNEMFKLLAPTPPSNWSSASLSSNSATYTARRLSSGLHVTITQSATPTFTVAIPSNGLGEVASGNTLTFDVDGVNQDVVSFFGTPTKSSGVIHYAYGDPYFGQQGKAGFWTGFTSASAIPTGLTSSSSQKIVHYKHSTKGTLSFSFYLDTPLTVSIDSLTATIPTMGGSVSGVPTLTAGQSITDIGFNIDNVSSYFYSSGDVWKLNVGLVQGMSGDPNSIPTSNGETGVVSGKTTTVLSNQYSEGFSFNVQAQNSVGVFGSISTYVDNSKRVDTVSNETERLTSGTGPYPTTGDSSTNYGNVFPSSTSLLTNTMDLQLKNGVYSWLNGNYTDFGGPNYTNVTTGDNAYGDGIMWRWATFNIGTLNSPVSKFFVLFNSNAVLGTAWTDIKLYVKVGSSGWLDATVQRSLTSPYSDGDTALSISESIAYYKRMIDFGTTPRSGVVYVRIGIKSTDTTFNFKKPTLVLSA
jgi:hypothetical protein